MTSPSRPVSERPAGACSEERATVETACAAAHAAKAAHEAAQEHLRALRRDLVAAGHRHEEAIAAADPAIAVAEKAAARDRYRLAQSTAEGEAALQEATAEYAGALDRVNRTTRLSQRAVSEAKAAIGDVERALREAERAEGATRLRADQADSLCLEARVRLAACEERLSTPASRERADIFEPHAATGGHVPAISGSGSGTPLVIESMVAGDRLALELAAVEMAEATGLSPAEAQLQLQELVAAIVSAAAADGYLVFDADHAFWSALTFEEARDVVAALERLGFVFEPSEGWHAARVPSPADLSMALAYAGLDARNMRHLPSAEDLAALPASIGIDARAFLAARAPDLTVDHVVRILERRAEELEPLWDEWGQVRPILLADRHSLGSVEG